MQGSGEYSGVNDRHCFEIISFALLKGRVKSNAFD
jgi:hypothetical protein